MTHYYYLMFIKEKKEMAKLQRSQLIKLNLAQQKYDQKTSKVIKL